MRPSALRKHAVAAGITDVELEHADDAEDSKAALIDLLVKVSVAPDPHH